jgi:putative aldouronate transport system permease protein
MRQVGRSWRDRAESWALDVLMAITILVTIYPVVLVISLSISDPVNVIARQVYLFPKGFSLEAYSYVLKDQDLWMNYRNTLYYTLVGTAINLVLSIITAYAVSRPKFCLRNAFMFFMTFTMFFGGGLIPAFIIVSKLGLYNSRWAILLPGAISAYNTIVARTFFATIPESMHESAHIDGANELEILSRIFVPLSAPIISVLVLFYAVSHWNSYFSALIYLPDRTKQPVQLYLIRVVMEGTLGALQLESAEDARKEMMTLQFKYVVIVVVMLPIILVYPFLQRYFVKGIMIGAIKS